VRHFAVQGSRFGFIDIDAERGHALAGATAPYPERFDDQGTLDLTSWLAAPTSLDLIEAAWGWDAARAYMSDLADFAVDTIAGAFSTLSGEHHDAGGDVMPAGRGYTVTFLALLPASPVTVDGVTAEVRGQDGRWSVRVDAVDAVVRTGPLRVGADPTEAARVILEEAQAGNPEKLEAWEIVRSGRPTADRLVELQAVDLPASVLAAVAEVVGSVTSATS
jgi:hypothetical protein